MSETPSPTENRLDRRKARTRAALIRAAQTLIAQGRTNVPILEITQAADVGMGSFYNHFENKEQLFEAAVEAVMDGYGQLLDDLTADIDDPAKVFACSFRLTGRLQRSEPELGRVFLNNVLRLLTADSGLAPRARRDIKAAVDAGRFDVEDLDVAVTITAGTLLALGQLLDDLTADIEDPAEVFACSFRLTGRLQHREPELSRVLLNNVLRLLSADNGLAPRARRDIAAAVDAGRFDVEDLDVAVTMAAGALIALGQLLLDQPERDVEETTDRVTEELLRMLGVPRRQAQRISSLPLPDIVAVRGDGSAA